MLKWMQTKKCHSPHGFTVLVGVVYVLLIVVLGLILLKLYNTPSSEELIAVQNQTAGDDKFQSYEMLEAQPLAIGDQQALESKPYDPWNNRPVVNSPRMPDGPEPPERDPRLNLPPVINPPFAFSTQPPVNQPSTSRSDRCCRCLRIRAARVESEKATTPAFTPSKGMQETTLPITNQP